MYSIDGTNFQSDPNFTVGAGEYTVWAKDANECPDSDTESITAPPAIVAGAEHTAILCFGGSSTLTASATGGTPPYMYSIDGTNFQSDPNFTVGAGEYTVWAKDANQCPDSDTESITAPPAIVAGAEHTQIECFGGFSTLTVSATGGTPPYMYSIDGTNFQSDPNFTVLAGQYTVWAKDANQCPSSDTELVPEGPSCGHGCTPGFWQGGKGKQTWDKPSDPIAQAVGFTTDTQISAVLPGIVGKCDIPLTLKMVDAITLGGGNCRKLVRHGVAAILNATTLEDYPLPASVGGTVQGLKDAIIAAVNNNCGCEPLASELALNNELNHDLCGTITAEVTNQLINTSLKPNGNSTARTIEENSFTASPVPFKDQITVSYNFDFVTDVNIEVFNTTGDVVAKKLRH
jgi:hypothetical protein